jgi:hypothetical protein
LNKTALKKKTYLFTVTCLPFRRSSLCGSFFFDASFLNTQRKVHGSVLYLHHPFYLVATKYLKYKHSIHFICCNHHNLIPYRSTIASPVLNAEVGSCHNRDSSTFSLAIELNYFIGRAEVIKFSKKKESFRKAPFILINQFTFGCVQFHFYLGPTSFHSSLLFKNDGEQVQS